MTTKTITVKKRPGTWKIFIESPRFSDCVATFGDGPLCLRLIATTTCELINETLADHVRIEAGPEDATKLRAAGFPVER